MKKLISILTLMAVVMSIASVFTVSAYADIPNVILPGPEPLDNTTEVMAGDEAWYSVNGYPSWDDIVAIGDGERVVGPPAKYYLSEYKVRYIKAKGGNHIFVYWSSASLKNPEMIEHGAKVYVLAENGNASLIIYRTLDNTSRSGWVSTGLLSDTYPGHTVSVGTEANVAAANIGDPKVSWSGKKMVGTNCEYLLVDEPIENCVGFTLEYRAEYKNDENCSGARSLYVNNGEGWKYVGQFQYETRQSYHVEVHLEEPTTVYAIATPMKVELRNPFTVRTCVVDALVSDR